jgi:hypothetical protein
MPWLARYILNCGWDSGEVIVYVLFHTNITFCLKFYLIICIFVSMKKSLSVRTVILLALLGFAVLVSLLAGVAIQHSRLASYSNQIESLRDDLRLLAEQLTTDWDEEDVNPYSFFDNSFSSLDVARWTFYYMLQGSDGTIIAPRQLAGKRFLIDRARAFRCAGGQAILGRVHGQRSFVVPYNFSYNGSDYVLSGVYDDDYIFGDRLASVAAFLAVLGVLLVILLLVCWIWIIPVIQCIVRRKNMAEGELQMARKLQLKSVTQEFPSDPRFSAYGVLRTMKEVGGDVYGCELYGNSLFLMIGDVSGKGMESAFVMFLLSSYIYARSEQKGDLPALMRECNSLLFKNRDYDCFCTLLMASLDLDSQVLTYCNAGHMRMIVDGQLLKEDPQMVVGAFPDYPYRMEKVQLHHGSRLVLYTDGVTEARNEAGEFYGVGRLLSCVCGFGESASSREICDGILGSIATFRGRAVQNDDIAILCVDI